MRNTTSPTPAPAFESIDISVLENVQGGCGKKKCCNCSATAVAIAAPAPAPAPAPMPMAPPPAPSVETSVNVSYQ